MKKKVNVTIDEEVWQWMEDNFINKSAWINCIIKQKYTARSINISEEKEKNNKNIPLGV